MQLMLQCKSNKYYIFQKCLFVALGAQREMRKRHIVIRGLSGSTIFFRIISQKTRVLKNKVTEHEMRVLIFSTSVESNISHSKKI